MSALPNLSGSESASKPGRPWKEIRGSDGKLQIRDDSCITIGESSIPLCANSGSYWNAATPVASANDTAAMRRPQSLTSAIVATGSRLPFGTACPFRRRPAAVERLFPGPRFRRRTLSYLAGALGFAPTARVRDPLTLLSSKLQLRDRTGRQLREESFEGVQDVESSQYTNERGQFYTEAGLYSLNGAFAYASLLSELRLGQACLDAVSPDPLTEKVGDACVGQFGRNLHKSPLLANNLPKH